MRLDQWQTIGSNARVRRSMPKSISYMSSMHGPGLLLRPRPRSYDVVPSTGLAWLEAYLVLRQILRAACARAGPTNSGMKAPKPQRPRSFLYADEAAKVLAWVKEHEPQYAAVILSHDGPALVETERVEVLRPRAKG